ncbi:MAG: ISNCY family transposase [Bacteroidales bacterium]
MRKTYENQQTFGNVDISKIKTNPKSRDEIDKTVRGLQYLYTNNEIRTEIFKLLEEHISPNVSKRTGRRGMDLWKILVLGVIRQVCSWDYDKLHHMANNNLMIRELLGHDRTEWDDRYFYELQTLKDNVSLLTPELLNKINEIVVTAGHNLLGGKKKEELRASVDSFVVKTDIHFPTDISLLYDSMRKSIELTSDICEENNITDCRQSTYHIKSLKREIRKIQKSKHSGKASTAEKIQTAHRAYILKAQKLLTKVRETISKIIKENPSSPIILVKIMGIEKYIKYAEQQIDLIERRVLKGEVIPHSEKIFSIFEPHTRWISKGKAGVAVEFGLPVSIMKDQHGYILDYEIMEKTSDVDIAVPLARRAKEKYSSIKSCSFDKGYWSPSNRSALEELIEKPVMPKKGRLNKFENAEESAEEFIRLRRKHSSVESSINGLDHCGLDKCYDHGLSGFERCVGLSILARNIHTLGRHIKEKEEKRKKRKKYKKAA